MHAVVADSHYMLKQSVLFFVYANECLGCCPLSEYAPAVCRRAQEIDPGYCEPSYWIALTRINQGDVQGGLAAMKASLTCKYTAAEALQTLNKLYLMMHEGAQADPMPMLVSIVGTPYDGHY